VKARKTSAGAAWIWREKVSERVSGIGSSFYAGCAQ
jgi:hypothetical protein